MPGWLDDAKVLDTAVYAAVAGTETPTLDPAMRQLSRAADHGLLWLGVAAGLAALGGRSGRRAAARGLVSLGFASALANAVAKPLTVRRRPDREQLRVLAARQVAMPRSSSFPSGHSASAWAFATGVSLARSPAAGPIRALATVVAYSRVHTGVHYPGDVIAGGLIGVTAAELADRLLSRRG